MLRADCVRASGLPARLVVTEIEAKHTVYERKSRSDAPPPPLFVETKHGVKKLACTLSVALLVPS